MVFMAGAAGRDLPVNLGQAIDLFHVGNEVVDVFGKDGHRASLALSAPRLKKRSVLALQGVRPLRDFRLLYIMRISRGLGGSVELTEALLIVAVTFFLVVVALIIAFRFGLAKEFERAAELREAQRQSVDAARRQTQETQERTEKLRQRALETQQKNDEYRVKNDALHARAEALQDRAERHLERWANILDRVEALVERLDKR
jgi:hypothetical protein